MKKIIIIGSGITGLVTALLLREQFKDEPVQITIYEQRPAIEHIGGALTIWPNGSEVLLSLPCAKQIRHLAGKLAFENWGNSSGETIRQVSRDYILRANGSPFMNICRSELLSLLLETFGEDNVKFNKKVVRVEQTSETATAYFADGTSATADLIVGADGTFSTLRRAMFPEAQLNYTGYIALVGIFVPKENLKHHVIWGENRLCLYFPISDGRYMVYTICPAPKGALKSELSERPQQFKKFMGWSAEVDTILRSLEEYLQAHPEQSGHYYCSENFDMTGLPSLYRGRVVLLGDAAHPMGSIMGLGTNLAMEDVCTFVDMLAKVKDIESALYDYSTAQMRRAAVTTHLEALKKAFFLEMTPEQYTEFQKNVSTATQHEFFQDVFSTIIPARLESNHYLRLFHQVKKSKSLVSADKIMDELSRSSHTCNHNPHTQRVRV